MDNISTDVLLSAQWHSDSSLHGVLLLITLISGGTEISIMRFHSNLSRQWQYRLCPADQHALVSCCFLIITWRCCRLSALRRGHTPSSYNPCSQYSLGFLLWLKALWHAGMLAFMQRESTNGISLIRAPGSLPPKHRRRQLTISAWPGQSSRLRGDGEQGQMRPVPNTHSFTSLFHSQTKWRRGTHTVTFGAKGMTRRSGGIIIAFLRPHSAPYDTRAARDLAVEKSCGTNAFLREEVDQVRAEVRKSRKLAGSVKPVWSQFNWLARLKFFSSFQASGTKKHSILKQFVVKQKYKYRIERGQALHHAPSRFIADPYNMRYSDKVGSQHSRPHLSSQFQVFIIL